jgi:hypothetical protein
MWSGPLARFMHHEIHAHQHTMNISTHIHTYAHVFVMNRTYIQHTNTHNIYIYIYTYIHTCSRAGLLKGLERVRDAHQNPEVSGLAAYVVKQIMTGQKELQTDTVLSERQLDAENSEPSQPQQQQQADGDDKKQAFSGKNPTTFMLRVEGLKGEDDKAMCVPVFFMCVYIPTYAYMHICEDVFCPRGRDSLVDNSLT